MKYVGTILFLFGMYWTWGLAKNEQAISQEVHVSIQDDLKKLIGDYIQQNLPNSNNLRFERFWTEANTDNQVKATFTYSFDDSNDSVGEARVQIEGYAILNRVKETSDSIEWSFDKLEILSNSVDYKDPMSVTPAAAEASQTEAPQQPEQSQPEKPQDETSH